MTQAITQVQVLVILLLTHQHQLMRVARTIVVTSKQVKMDVSAMIHVSFTVTAVTIKKSIVQ
jgi:hypothetical protein